ncbi:hypothetical protein C9994_17725 [Marivirga lumbricoides]|uniref:Uncharacterized protein n=1 Tax=Marivirga lumbricoides TaxID=1046115 RepID=A0A2T4D3W3_9BACT|nr:hypothetical protein C9994_17725 [Marivirga lumbricoides]
MGTRFYVNPDIRDNFTSAGLTFGYQNSNNFGDRVDFTEKVQIDELNEVQFYSGGKPTLGRDICVFDFIVTNENAVIMDNEYLAVMTFPVITDDFTRTTSDCRNQQW